MHGPPRTPPRRPCRRGPRPELRAATARRHCCAPAARPTEPRALASTVRLPAPREPARELRRQRPPKRAGDAPAPGAAHRDPRPHPPPACAPARRWPDRAPRRRRLRRGRCPRFPERAGRARPARGAPSPAARGASSSVRRNSAAPTADDISRSGCGCDNSQLSASASRDASPVSVTRPSSVRAARGSPGLSASQRCVQASDNPGSPSASCASASASHSAARGTITPMARSSASDASAVRPHAQRHRCQHAHRDGPRTDPRDALAPRRTRAGSMSPASSNDSAATDDSTARSDAARGPAMRNSARARTAESSKRAAITSAILHTATRAPGSPEQRRQFPQRAVEIPPPPPEPREPQPHALRISAAGGQRRSVFGRQLFQFSGAPQDALQPQPPARPFRCRRQLDQLAEHARFPRPRIGPRPGQRRELHQQRPARLSADALGMRCSSFATAARRSRARGPTR